MTPPTSDLRQILLNGVGWTVIGQLYVILAISILTFGLLLLRDWRRKRFEFLESYYGDIIMAELLENEAGEIPLVKRHRPRWYQWFRRRALKRILLNHIRSIAGPEKVLLVKTYCMLEFANRDRDNCYSMFWWRRLEGLSSLSGLDIHDSALIFDDLRKDREELVALAATLALSGIKHPRNDADILRDLSPKALARRNLLLQVANNWARVYGASFVLTRLRFERRDELIKVFVEALAELNSPDVGHEMAKWLMADDHQREPQTLVCILRTLKTIGDPDSAGVAKSFLNHSDEYVRCEAIDLLSRLGSPADVFLGLRALEHDSSLSVQRMLRQIQEKQVAA